MADDLSCVLWQPGTDSDSLLVDSTVSCLIGPVLSAAPATVLRRLARAARMAGRGPLLDVSALELGPFVGAVPVPVLPSLTLVDGVVLPLPLAVAHVLAGAPLDLLPPDPHTGQPLAVIGLGAPHGGLIVGPAPVHWVYAFLVLHLLDLGPGLAWALPARSYSAVFVPRLMFSRLSSAYALALIVGLAGRGLDLARLASDPQFFFSSCRSFSRGLDPAELALEAARVYAFLVLHLLDLGPGLAWALPARSYSAVFVPRLMFSRLSSAYALALIVGLAGRGLDLGRLASDPQFFFSSCRSFSRGLDPAGRALEAALSGARS